jgi:hypothetical protein
MYLSHPVRRVRFDPQPGRSIALVVEIDPDSDDVDADALRRTVAELEGTFDRELGFDTYSIELPEEAVDDLCDTRGIVRIETAATIEAPPKDEVT